MKRGFSRSVGYLVINNIDMGGHVIVNQPSNALPYSWQSKRLRAAIDRRKQEVARGAMQRKQIQQRQDIDSGLRSKQRSANNTRSYKEHAKGLHRKRGHAKSTAQYKSAPNAVRIFCEKSAFFLSAASVTTPVLAPAGSCCPCACPWPACPVARFPCATEQ